MPADSKEVHTAAAVSTKTEDVRQQEEELQRMFDLNGCEGFEAGGLQNLLQRPNVAEDGGEDVNSLCVKINGQRRSVILRGCVGKLVPQGSIGLVSHNGKIEAVPEGRWWIPLLCSRTTWRGIQSLTFDRVVAEGALTVVRVPRGSYGLGSRGGQNLLLGEGLHVYNDALFRFASLVPVSKAHIQHGPLHVVRVTRGEYAKVWVLGPSGALEPRLLREGCYAVDSNLFSLDGRCSVADALVSHGALHILQVPKGSVAKVVRDNVPQLLGEGPHYVNSTNFQFKGTSNLADPIISHGTITVVRVNKGQVGLAWQDNNPLFMQEPGIYNFDSPSFTFVRSACVTEKLIELGTKKIVTVFSGEAGLSYNRGELCILQPGQHVIDDAAHVVQGFLSTQQKSVRLAPAGPDKNREEPDLLICETKDFVKVGIRADVFYSIKDPEKAMQQVAKDEIEKLVLETSLATVTNILRSTTLNEIAQSKAPSAISSKQHQASVQAAQALGDTSAPLFFDKAHDEFLSKLHDEFLERYGIEITNIRIESFKIIGEELANNISQQALTTAQTECQLANLAGQTEIATKQQEREATMRQIGAQSEADALKVVTDSKNAALISEAEAQAKAAQVKVEWAARAEATSTIERAKAEAEAIRLRGQAEAEAFETKAHAEAKRAEMLAATPLGSQLSLLSVYAEMVAKANEGVQKIVYSDLKENNLGCLGMPLLQNLGRDLSLLQNVDKAMDAAPSAQGP